MGFFDGLLSAIPGASLLSAGANIAGALIGANGANDAASTVADASAAARAQLEADKTAGLGFIDTGAQKATDYLTPMTVPQPIELPQYRGLTQQQQIGQADNIRNGQATLAASGLRGAGRAGVASIMDANNRYEASARAANDASNLTAEQTAQQTANQAKINLANLNSSTGMAKANTEIGVGSQIANSLQSSGKEIAGMQLGGANTMGSGITMAGNNIASGMAFQSGYNNGNSPNQGPPITYPGGQDPSQYQIARPA